MLGDGDAGGGDAGDDAGGVVMLGLVVVWVCIQGGQYVGGGGMDV